MPSYPYANRPASNGVFDVGKHLCLVEVGLSPRATMHLALDNLLTLGVKGKIHLKPITIELSKTKVEISFSINNGSIRGKLDPIIEECILEIINRYENRIPPIIRKPLMNFVRSYSDVIQYASKLQNEIGKSSHVHLSNNTPLGLLTGERKNRHKKIVSMIDIHQDGINAIRHCDGMNISIQNNTIDLETNHTWTLDSDKAFPIFPCPTSPRLKERVFNARENETIFFCGINTPHSAPPRISVPITRQLISANFSSTR